MFFARSKARGSLQVRLVALFMAIFGLTLIGYSFFLYIDFGKTHETEFDIALYNYTVDVARAVNVNLLGGVTLTPDVLAPGEKVFPFALGETLLQVRTLAGRPIARSSSLREGGLPFTAGDQAELVAERVLFRTLPAARLGQSSASRSDYRMALMLLERPGTSGLVLQVAVPMVLISKEKRGLRSFFLFSIPAVLVLAAVGGLYLSRKALEPLNAILEKVNQISPDQLSERVPVPQGKDEIHRLAVTLNALLERIESTFRSQETFIADASHQLKTPLAILRGELDMIRSRPRSDEEVKVFLSSASQEISQLSRLVENLLLLARIDTGAACLARTSVRMDELVMECVSRFERLAQERGVRLVLNLLAGEESASNGTFESEGDPDLLRILIENLVENAIKYSPRGSSISISLEDQGPIVRCEVRDEGRGISPEALGRVFERFYRADEARETDGSGLGLAIVKKIVDIHQGEIHVESKPGTGARFTFMLSKKQGDGVSIPAQKYMATSAVAKLV